MGNVFSPQLTDEQKAIGLKLRKQGKEYREIANILGLEVNYIRKRLPQYIKIVCPDLIAPSKRHKKSNRVVLTVNDITNYKHNDNTPRENNNILMSVQIDNPEDFGEEPVFTLSERITARRLAGEKERQKGAMHIENNLFYVRSKGANINGRYI